MDISQALYEIKNNDSEPAFRYIYDHYYERIFRTSFYFLRNDDEAREAALDVLASLWRNRKTMIFPRDFDSYCFIAAKNVSLNILSSKSRHAHGELDEVHASDLLSPHDELVAEELFQQYERALYQLPDRCREVFIMVKEEGRSYADVADVLGISTKTVDAQMQKALKHLRQHLQKYLGHSSPSVRSLAFFLVM